MAGNWSAALQSASAYPGVDYIWPKEARTLPAFSHDVPGCALEKSYEG